MVKTAIKAGLWVLVWTLARADEYFVDCSASAEGNGSRERPWNSLEQVNERVFGAGDCILFRAGCRWGGVLRPQGSGSEQAPIRITSFAARREVKREEDDEGKEEEDEKDEENGEGPIIDGEGATAAMVLTNQDHWIISHLTVTNAGEKLAMRQGIYVAANDGKTHRGIRIEANQVHHVAGQTDKAKHAADFSRSACISVNATPPSRYDDVLVKANCVSNCGGGGIKVRTGGMQNRGQAVQVTQNRIDACGGDGIVTSYSTSPLLDYNVASNLGKGAYPWTGGNFAGIWVLGNRDPVMAHNVVYGTVMSVFDSMAFDCDWGNEGVCVVEYNFSRDNAGGAFLNCDGCGTPGGADQVVRYNVFQNDCRIYSNGDLPELSFYNNVVYCPDKPFDLVLPPRTRFTNNIFIGNASSKLPSRHGIEWLDNVFDRVPPPTDNGIRGDAGLVDAGSGGSDLDSVAGYMLRASSVALANGRVVADNGGRDFFGNPVSSSDRPNRGVYNGPGV
ncbi:hypothetical protein CDD81_555 [Ophiocordyceps australis]|uniref:Right handed beta helix domain-containing protein n=1 Tax=Ophiocordyceps australis TaxID=1399860 RepID=A0A2C5YEX8_9HYPO|nr:hypothetical protein CDD81_555 [Ophiocordyceps australis]